MLPAQISWNSCLELSFMSYSRGTMPGSGSKLLAAHFALQIPQKIVLLQFTPAQWAQHLLSE
ncbi:MAG: hypothetical protein D8G53_11990 [Candidatus Saccharimonas sp.]|nr:MAG: hypothetical protein D8G53_11990 [Candidatus Saccharimonas sp.]